MASVGTVTGLDDNLRLDGVESASGLAMSVRPTFGSPFVQSCPSAGGNTLSLVSSRSGNDVIGIFTRSQVIQLAVIRDAGNPVTLIHHLGTFTVILPPHALDGLSQVMDYADPPADSWYTGSLIMIEV